MKEDFKLKWYVELIDFKVYNSIVRDTGFRDQKERVF